MNYEQKLAANQTLLKQPKTGIYRPQNGWMALSAKFTEHKRRSQAYADATAIIDIVAHPKNGSMSIEIEERFEASNGHLRSNGISISFSEKNIEALERFLIERREAKVKANG